MTLMKNHGNLTISENQRPFQFMEVKVDKVLAMPWRNIENNLFYPPGVLNMDNEDWS